MAEVPKVGEVWWDKERGRKATVIDVLPGIVSFAWEDLPREFLSFAQFLSRFERVEPTEGK